MRAGHYKGWLPTLFVGNLLQHKTVGVIGAGRIGARTKQIQTIENIPETK